MLGSSLSGNIPSMSRQEFEAEIQALSLHGDGVCGGGGGGGCYAFCAQINVCLKGDTFIQKAHCHL